MSGLMSGIWKRSPWATAPDLDSTIFRRHKRAVLRSVRIAQGQIFASLSWPPTAKNLTAARGHGALGPRHRQRSAAPFCTRHSDERLAARPADVGRLRPLRRTGLTAPAWCARWPHHSIGAGRRRPDTGGLLGTWFPSRERRMK